ncbi:hypothetical protein BIW11_09556, partial [Tropilaelaps mercedesae]
LLNASTILLHENVLLEDSSTLSDRKSFTELLATQRAQLRASLENNAASLQEFVRHSSSATIDRILSIVRFMTVHSDLFELVLSVTLPVIMCWSLTVGELTHSARLPLISLWTSMAIGNHMFHDNFYFELRRAMLLATVCASLVIYVLHCLRSLRKYHREVKRLQRASDKADALLAQFRRFN